MGVIYKLREEIKNYILEQKKINPTISCRGLSDLIESQFKTTVSKSSINTVLKISGLSMPVGRRQKRKRRKLEIRIPPLVEFKPQAPIPPTEAKIETPPPTVELPPVTPPASVLEEMKVEISLSSPAPAPVVEPQPAIPREMSCTGAVLLKAADYLVSGSHLFTEIVRKQYTHIQEDLSAKSEALIYLALLELSNASQALDLTPFWPLLGKKISPEELSVYLNELQMFKTAVPEVIKEISSSLKEVRSLKVDCLDGSTYYLDGQLHTIWSSAQLPIDFSSTLYYTKTYINRHLKESLPFILFMAPGQDTPSREFFSFMSSLESSVNMVNKIILCGSKFEELEMIPQYQNRKRFFMFGLWPTQFAAYRKVNKIGEFRPYRFEPLKQDFYLGDIELDILQPAADKRVTFKGCALKTNPNEKIKLVILSNFEPESMKLEDLATLYLSRWPNLEEALQDYQRKIELFTYAPSGAAAQESGSVALNAADLKGFFRQYVQVLDSFVRRYFLPESYKNKAFPAINEQFYSLPAVLTPEKDVILIKFNPPLDFSLLEDLKYACRRINEKEIAFSEGKRLWLTA